MENLSFETLALLCLAFMFLLHILHVAYIHWTNKRMERLCGKVVDRLLDLEGRVEELERYPLGRINPLFAGTVEYGVKAKKPKARKKK